MAEERSIEVCGNCGAASQSDAIVCATCGAILAAYGVSSSDETATGRDSEPDVSSMPEPEIDPQLQPGREATSPSDWREIFGQPPSIGSNVTEQNVAASMLERSHESAPRTAGNDWRTMFESQPSVQPAAPEPVKPSPAPVPTPSRPSTRKPVKADQPVPPVVPPPPPAPPAQSALSSKKASGPNRERVGSVDCFKRRKSPVKGRAPIPPFVPRLRSWF